MTGDGDGVAFVAHVESVAVEAYLHFVGCRIADDDWGALGVGSVWCGEVLAEFGGSHGYAVLRVNWCWSSVGHVRCAFWHVYSSLLQMSQDGP